ncbi:Do family serine endopeptidase [Kaistia dalseonensis]|uniref:Probable periplasmic serine endoprotease DegP-like n=1 Tax=Kaistia dalseonensis TaxID=410840 RepID=A0ABU0HCQ3_9HYPH|nr:Do family serine endopeptidase [Kaistia dalseonensis]MCX5497096.1 Do family serine endopeptidase [Kaistia dalseonensis]MDQ0439722.1 serine protease Do [Kaistia dalseonensis]
MAAAATRSIEAKARASTRRFGLAAAILGALFVAVPAGTPAFAQQGPASVADLAAGLLDSVVNISTSQTVAGTRGVPAPSAPEGSPFQEFFDEFFNKQKGPDGQAEAPPRKVQSLGSGFVIDSSGIIITNNHVIEDADEIVANFSDGSKLTATLLGKDEKTDLAVLQVKPNPAKPLKALRFGDSDKMRVGDWVMAIGNPFGLGGTVTLGIVSARNRDINSGPYDNFIQTDAAINRGNSGGPLFNMYGEVIGINTAIISPSGGSIGIGFAIPSDAAMHVVDQLRQYGETRRGWLGVRIQQVTDEIAESLNMGPARGALVAGITDKGPAAEAKIEPGDVVISFDGKPITEMRDLPRLVADAPIDKVVDVVVIRKGAELTLKVKVGRLTEAAEASADTKLDDQPAEPPKPIVTEALGLTLAELTPDLRTKYNVAKDVNGVVITAVAPGSGAAEKGVAVGEVVVEVSQESVAKPEDITARIDTLKKDGRKSALFLIANTAGELRFVPLKLDE